MVLISTVCIFKLTQKENIGGGGLAHSTSSHLGCCVSLDQTLDFTHDRPPHHNNKLQPTYNMWTFQRKERLLIYPPWGRMLTPIGRGGNCDGSWWCYVYLFGTKPWNFLWHVIFPVLFLWKLWFWHDVCATSPGHCNIYMCVNLLL